MSKYNITYHKDYQPLNLRNVPDNPEYNISDENLNSLIERYVTNRKEVPGFDIDISDEKKIKYLDKYKENARARIEFNCDGNKKLTKAKHGKLASLVNRPCNNGKFIYYTTVKKSPEDLFEGATELPSPNITISFDDNYITKFRLVYMISLYINLKITCGDQEIDTKVHAFKGKDIKNESIGDAGFPNIEIFQISKIDVPDEWINIRYDFAIPEITNYNRVQKNNSELTPTQRRLRQKFYMWMPLVGDPTWQNILINGTYEIIDTDIEKPLLDGNSNIIFDRINNLVQDYLTLREKELSNTLMDDVFLNDKEKKDWLTNGCSKIEIMGYSIVDGVDDNLIGLKFVKDNLTYKLLDDSIKMKIITSIQDIPIDTKNLK